MSGKTFGDGVGRTPNDGIDRRHFIGVGSAAMMTMLLSRTSASDLQETAKAHEEGRASDSGPENPSLQAINPNGFVPPATDHGEVETFWASFSSAHRRIQEGGWSRQVTVEDFPISKDIAGVNMRLPAGGGRELHWHAGA